MTIKDIARLSGVGIATVSRVINSSGPVSEETHAKVMRVVNEHQYVPNANARNLKAIESKNISLLVKGLKHPFFQQMIRQIELDVSLRGYSLIIHDVFDIADELQFALQEKRENNVCAVILVGGSFTYSEEEFEKLGIPCVLLTVSPKELLEIELVSSVTINDELEGFRATEHLIGLGHKAIGFVFRNIGEKNTPNERRYQGYLRALEEHGLPFAEGLVAQNIPNTGGVGYRMGFDAFRQIYTARRDVTAVFCFADILAIGAAKCALTMGLSIPNDISVLGFDGLEIAEFFHPSLDSVSQPAREMALSTVSLLFSMMQGESPQHVVYDCAILARGSTRNIG